MADVTINELTRGTPTGGNILPYSTGSNTLGVPVSAILQNAGNIGIGTSNPLRLLHVEGITPGSQQVPFHVGCGESSIGFGVLECPVIFGWNGTLNSAHKPLSIRSTSAIQLYLNTDGKVGIGTTTPAAKLDVNGDVNINGYLTTNLARVFAIRSVGNVGNNSVVPWNNVLVNKGNNYNASTGRFTAPKTGLYRVSAFFILGLYGGGGGGGSGNFNIRVNQVTYANCHVNHNDTWDNSSMDVIVSLNTGDYVDCYVDALVSYTANPFVFYGFGYNGFSVEQLP